MKRLALVLIVGFTFALTGCGGNADKIIGVWTVEKFKKDGKEDAKDKNEKSSATIEFTKDGKVIFKVMEGDKEQFKKETTYKVEVDKITSTEKDKDGKDKPVSLTIKTLTSEVLVLADDEKKEEMELKKKK